MRFALLVALVSACGSSPAAQRHKAQKEFASELVPAQLKPTPTAGKVSEFRVRVYADDKHRAQILNWERKISVVMRRASAILAPTAGVELEIVESKPWTRKSSSMETMLTELEDLDPGGDVHLVIGLIDALPGVSSTFNQLGVARPLGKHMIMRGLNDAKEVEVLDAALGTLGRESRDELYSIRGKHKLTLVLLHEFAHTLGAIHVGGDLNILAPTYDVKQDSFTKENAELMRIAATFRAKAEVGDSRAEELGAISAHLEAVGKGSWIPDEREALTKLIAERLASDLTGGTSLSELSEGVRPDHRRFYRDAVNLADSGKILEAWEKAEPLIDFYPDEPAVAVLACRLASARRLSAEQVKTWCEKAAKLAPADITPTLTLAVADINAKNIAKAAALLDGARQRLLSVEGQHDEAWLKLAEAYQKLGLVRLAEDAAGRSKDGGDIAGWAKQRAAKFGVPPLDSKKRSKKLSPIAEADYVNAVRAALKLVYARDYAKALEAASDADKRFGATPGMETVRCDLEIRRRAYSKALRYCRKALKLFEAGSWANYLTGLLHKQAKRRGKAVKHLERSIELDPEQRHAYEILVGLYDDAKQTDKATTLRATFKKRFGAEL